MIVKMRFEFNERDRLAISHYYGDSKPASRETIKTWMIGIVNATLEDHHFDLDKADESES